MTVFLMVLRKLIKAQLGPLSANLATQSKSLFYNKDLSLDQKEIIDLLEENVWQFQGSDKGDKEDSETICEFIDTAHKKIQEKRELNRQGRDSGTTINCLTNLMFHTSGFYRKLADFKFCLLQMPYTETPQNVIYFHAAYYFGEEIFTPLPGIDVKLRAKKEDKLAMRLQSLSEFIKPTHSLEEQKERCNQVLNDLVADNRQLINGDESLKNMALPGLSFIGFQLTAPNGIFSPSEGRLGQQFNLAFRKIKDMTEDKFQPPLVPESGSNLVGSM